jgi:hypothetical protein
LRILFIQQTSTVYVAEVLNPKAAYPAKLRKGAVVHFRIAGDDLYLKDPAGPEIWTRLLEKNPKGPLRKSE